MNQKSDQPRSSLSLVEWLPAGLLIVIPLLGIAIINRGAAVLIMILFALIALFFGIFAYDARRTLRTFREDQEQWEHDRDQTESSTQTR